MIPPSPSRSSSLLPVTSRAAWWPMLRRIGTVVLMVAVMGMLVWNAQHVDWPGVLKALRDYPADTLIVAALLTTMSFVVYSCFDLLARSYTKAFMSVGQVMTVTFVSHALGLNLGVAGVALRFRLYGAYGVGAAAVARIWGLSVLTNWLGFVVLGGIIFAGGLIDLPASTIIREPLGATTIFGAGLVLLTATAAYLVGCTVARGRGFSVFGREVQVPSVSFGVGQFLLSAANWTLIAAVMYVLLHGRIDFPTVLGVYLLSAIALSVVDVPGGLGVTEGVFIALLGSRMPLTELLAALVAYRAIFYIAPMLPALVAYVGIEAVRRKHAMTERRVVDTV